VAQKTNVIWGDEQSDKKEEKKTETYLERPSVVEVVDTHIYFYSYVGMHQVLRFNKEIRTLDNNLRVIAAQQEREPAPIFVHVNSFGGSLLHGLAAMDAILACKIPIITIVDGCCASAGTFFTVVGNKRLIGKHSFMLIHQLTACAWGKYEELKDDQLNFDLFMNTIYDIYKKYTKVPKKKLKEILKHDLWFDAETCLKYGMVDEII